MLVSVIIPVYNAGDYLPALLDRLERQADPRCEVIFVNDGSTDSSALILANSRYKVVNTVNGGVSSARNRGLSEAKGDFVIFIDADDTISDCFVQVMLRYAETGNDLTLFRHTRAVNGPAVFDAKTAPGLMKRDAMLEDFLYNTTAYGVYDLLIRRELLIDEGISFPEGYAYYEDYRFIIDVFASVEEAYLARECVYCYNATPGSAMSRFDDDRMRCLELFSEYPRLNGTAKEQYERFFASRIAWSAAWQAALVLGYKDFKRFCVTWRIKTYMSNLLRFRQKTILISAIVYIILPCIYYVIVRFAGSGRTLLGRGGRNEQA